MSVRFRQAFHDTFVRTFCSSFMNTTTELHHHGNRFSTKMPSMINHHSGSHHQKNDSFNTPPYRFGYTSYSDPMKRKMAPKTTSLTSPQSIDNDRTNGNNLATRNDNKQEESTIKQAAFNEINNNNNNSKQNHNDENNSIENKLNHFGPTTAINGH